jgi:hypothetical protein
MKTRRLDAFLSDLLSCHRDDPVNARYCVPLANAPEDETMAHAMADAIYSARAEDFSDHITEAQADRIYEQCLIDSRRMLRDGEYAAIFDE